MARRPSGKGGAQNGGAPLQSKRVPGALGSRERYVGPSDEAQLLALERDFVLAGRIEGARATEAPLQALAMSGGGIRSAAFAMGVLQSLTVAGRLSSFDYLSTVSGGGYVGTALTWWLKVGLPTSGATAAAGTDEATFPFGNRRRDGVTAQAQNRILDFVRHHASYLRPTPELGLLSTFAVILRSSFLSLAVYFTLLTGILGILLQSGFYDVLPDFWFYPFPGAARFLSSWPLYLSSLLFSFLAILALGYAVSTRLFSRSRAYLFRTSVQMQIGRLLGLACALFGVGTLPLIYLAWSSVLSTEVVDHPTFVLGLGSTLLGTVLGAQEGKTQTVLEEASRLTRARPLVGVSLVVYGLFVSSFVLADELGASWSSPLDFCALTLAGALAGWLVNTNYLGAHRVYRDRLMELFTPNLGAIRNGEWQPAEQADETGIHQACGADAGRCVRPYHLINTNVVLTGSPKTHYRGRGGDSFLLSPLYCGSRATGWIRSDRYMGPGTRTGMSLPSAMAISGAALNPGAGVGGEGITRSRLGSVLLSLLNLRLGYFAPHPARDKHRVPNLLVPGLSAGLLGVGSHENSNLVELTDGGHFENLGIYELIRRRVAFILVTDAGQDESFSFSDLASAVERVRVDFGVKIAFGPERGLDGLVPGAGVLCGDIPVAERAFALGTIHYPAVDSGDGRSREEGALEGQLVYIKATLFPGLPIDVLSYRKANSAFPHQSTSDQFFDERQFEAYRELGYHAGWTYLESLQEKAAAAKPPLDD